MPDIRIQRNLKIPPVPAIGALEEILSSIQEQRGGWRDFAVHASLADLRLPDVGYVAIPIRLEAGKRGAETNAFPVTFEAAKHPESFPRFSGSVGIDAIGPSDSTLFIGGGYDVPMNLLGKLLDVTLASGVAGQTLENLADDLAAAVHAIVERREAEYARYRLY